MRSGGNVGLYLARWVLLALTGFCSCHYCIYVIRFCKYDIDLAGKDFCKYNSGMEKPAKPGRPPRDPSGASRIVPVRMSDDEKEEFRAAAERAGMSLSDWVRDRLHKAAKREAK